MKSIEIENEKPNEKILNTESKGMVTVEGEYTTLRYKRQLSYPREILWKAITDPKELVGWMNTKAVIDECNGGTIDFVNTFS
jgi:hypothetical protein